MEIQEFTNGSRLCLEMLDWMDALLLVDWEGEEERGGIGGRIKYDDLQ